MNHTASRFSQHGSPFSHLNNNLLHLHMMNTTMNSQQRKTVHTDMNSMMISLQHNNLILRPNLKPKTTSHSQNETHPTSNIGRGLPLSVEDRPRLQFMIGNMNQNQPTSASNVWETILRSHRETHGRFPNGKAGLEALQRIHTLLGPDWDA